MKYLFLIVGLLLATTSCSKSRDNNSQRTLQPINVNIVGQPLRASQILKENKIIFLSSEDDEALIAKVDKLLVGDGRYFVMDRRTNKLMAFDGQGGFVASTERYIGKGPDSYLRIIDATIDNVSKKIHAHCDAPYCFMVFDFNLRLEKKIKMDYYMLEVADDDKYIYGIRTRQSSSLEYELVALDKEDLSAEPTILLVSSKGISGAGAIGRSMTSYGNGVNVCFPFDDVIYQISNKKIVKKYPLDFGKNGVDYSDIKDMTANQFYKSSYREKIWSIVNAYSSDSTLFFGCNRLYSFVLNRKTNECVGFSSWRNDLLPYSSTQTLPVDGVDGAFAYLWPSTYVMAFKNYVSEKKLDADFKKVLDGYEEEDNPLIILCEMK